MLLQACIWSEHGQGNENHVKKEKTLDEEDVERCDNLTLIWEGRIAPVVPTWPCMSMPAIC